MERRNSKEPKSKFKHRSSDDRSRLGHTQREGKMGLSNQALSSSPCARFKTLILETLIHASCSWALDRGQQQQKTQFLHVAHVDWIRTLNPATLCFHSHKM